MTTNKYFLATAILFGAVSGYAEETTSKSEATYAPNRLWYKQAAGKWTETLPLGNGRLGAPWEADFHLNINLQMNYWPADLCNLSDTMDSLTEWFYRVTEKGRVSARTLYDADGWVSHFGGIMNLRRIRIS